MLHIFLSCTKLSPFLFFSFRLQIRSVHLHWVIMSGASLGSGIQPTAPPPPSAVFSLAERPFLLLFGDSITQLGSKVHFCRASLVIQACTSFIFPPILHLTFSRPYIYNISMLQVGRTGRMGEQAAGDVLFHLQGRRRAQPWLLRLQHKVCYLHE